MGELRKPFYTAKVTDPETGEVRRERRQAKTWWIRYYRNGKRHEESSGSTKKGDAERLLRLREGDVAKGLPVTAQVGKLRFEEAAADVVLDHKVNGKRTTAQVERRIALHLLPVFGGRRMAEIGSDDVRAYQSHRQAQGAANGTINREVTVLKRAFRLAADSGKVLHRPAIPMLDEAAPRPGFFERGDFEDVRDNLPEHLRGLVTFLYLTGWRVGEVLPLEWRQVDRKAQTIRLEPGTTKNRRGRVVPYGALPELVEVVERAWSERQRLAAEGTLCPFVFQHRGGQRIGSFRKAWATACEAAGLRGRLIHDLRRSAVRNLVRAGVPDTVAMKITGHLTRSVFDRYNISSETDLRDGLGMLAGKEKGKRDGSGRVVSLASR